MRAQVLISLTLFGALACGSTMGPLNRQAGTPIRGHEVASIEENGNKVVPDTRWVEWLGPSETATNEQVAAALAHNTLASPSPMAQRPVVTTGVAARPDCPMRLGGVIVSTLRLENGAALDFATHIDKRDALQRSVDALAIEYNRPGSLVVDVPTRRSGDALGYSAISEPTPEGARIVFRAADAQTRDLILDALSRHANTMTASSSCPVLDEASARR